MRPQVLHKPPGRQDNVDKNYPIHVSKEKEGPGDNRNNLEKQPVRADNQGIQPQKADSQRISAFLGIGQKGQGKVQLPLEKVDQPLINKCMTDENLRNFIFDAV